MTGPPAAPVSCPDCGAPVHPRHQQLCGQCGYPLMFLRDRAGPAEPQFGVARAPGEQDRPAPAAPQVLLDPGPDRPAARPGEIGCPACSEINPSARIRCQRCGHELRAARPVPPVLPPMPPPRRSRTWLTVLAVAMLAVALGAALTVWVLRRDDRPRFARPDPTASVSLAPVPRSVVTVTATAADPDTPNYGVPNLLDGDLTRAWHSGGHLIATNIGVEVRFAFSRPVALARVTVVNGFARSPTDFTNNQRVRTMRVRTDAAERTWNLPDKADPQVVDLDGAPTTTVTFVIDAVYPGTKFTDVCITEVRFDERV
jgi:ribosomal protein L37E